MFCGIDIRTTAAATLAVGGVVVGALITRRWMLPPRVGIASCRCGQVQLQLNVPGSSRLVEQTSAMCACTDCVGFADFVAAQTRDGESIVDKTTGTTDMLQFYRSDVTTLSGADNVQACRLEKGSPMTRFFAKCCFTPLALTPNADAVPIFIIYRNLIQDTSVFPTSKVCLSFDSAKPGSVRPSGIVVRPTMLDFKFLCKVIGRVLVGMLLGKALPRPDSFSATDKNFLIVSEVKNAMDRVNAADGVAKALSNMYNYNINSSKCAEMV